MRFGIFLMRSLSTGTVIGVEMGEMELIWWCGSRGRMGWMNYGMGISMFTGVGVVGEDWGTTGTREL